MVKLHEEDQFEKLPKPTHPPGYGNLPKKEPSPPKDNVIPKAAKVEANKTYSKWDKTSPITTVPAAAVQKSSSSDFEIDDFEIKPTQKQQQKKLSATKNKDSLETMLKDFEVEPKLKQDHLALRLEQKPSPLSTYKDLLDDEELESLLGKESPSKSRLPHSRTKLGSPEGKGQKKKNYTYQPSRFSPEKRHVALPSIGSSKPPWADGHAKLHHQQRFGKGQEFNINNNTNVNENAPVGNQPSPANRKDSGRKPLVNRNDAFWSNLFGSEQKKKTDSPKLLPDIGSTRTYPLTKHTRYVGFENFCNSLDIRC